MLLYYKGVSYIGERDITEKQLADDYNDVFADIINRQEKNKPKYPIITIILYFGLKHWDKPTSLYECMNIPKELKLFVHGCKINLVEVAFLDDQLEKRHLPDSFTLSNYTL
ncbi:MAG: Rpn family recombination-promoting nuclease/putative transposase [Lachnospiraceae bacterium]